MDFFSFRLISTWFLFLPSSAFQLKGRIQNTDSGQWTTPVDPAHGPPYRPIPWTTLVDHGPPLGLSFFIHVHTLSALVSYACVCLFLLSVSGKVVSTRRTQVDEIMDHFNIQASCHFITTKLQSMDVTLSFQPHFKFVLAGHLRIGNCPDQHAFGYGLKVFGLIIKPLQNDIFNFFLQVDSPVSLLNQDSSRHLLQSNDESDLYKVCPAHLFLLSLFPKFLLCL